MNRTESKRDTGIRSLSVSRIAAFRRLVLVVDPVDCWLWASRVDRRGYGLFAVGRRSAFAHRIAKYLESGRLDAVAMHLCDVPACCNPAHIRWCKDSKENTLDAVAKGKFRGRRLPPGTPGERNGAAKLTWRAVSEIRNEKLLTRAVLAAKYGVHEQTISRVRAGRIWTRAS